MADITYRRPRNSCWRCVRLTIPLTRLLITLFFIPVVLILFIPFSIYRFLIWCYMKSKYGSKVAFMRSMDSAFAHETPNARSIINVLTVLEGDVHLEEFRQQFIKRYLEQDLDGDGKPDDVKLTKRGIRKGGYWFWLECRIADDFDVNEHIRNMDELEKINDNIVTENRVMDSLSQICNRGFSEDKPQWEMLFIPNFVYDNEVNSTSYIPKRFGVIIRIHHSYGDGISLIRNVMSTLCTTPIETPLPELPKLSILQKIGLSLWAISYVPKNLINSFITETNALRGPKLKGEKIVQWSKPVSMTVIKLIKLKTKATVTDILLSSVSETLHSYYYKHSCDEIPDHVNAVIPIPMKIPEREDVRNVISPLLLKLPTAMSHPLQRLKETQTETKKQKKKPNIYTNYWTIRMALKILPEHLTRGMSDRAPSTVVLSNMPGPQQYPELVGCKMVDFMFWVPNKGDIGVGISLMSLAGNVRMGLLVDKALIAQKSTVESLLESWVENLHKLDTLSNEKIEEDQNVNFGSEIV